MRPSAPLNPLRPHNSATYRDITSARTTPAGLVGAQPPRGESEGSPLRARFKKKAKRTSPTAREDEGREAFAASTQSGSLRATHDATRHSGGAVHPELRRMANKRTARRLAQPSSVGSGVPPASVISAAGRRTRSHRPGYTAAASVTSNPHSGAS